MARAAHFSAVVKEGRLIWADPGRAAGYLARCKDKRLKVTVELDTPRRSLKANAKLWATYHEALAGMEGYSGHTPDELHEAFKVLFCPEKPVPLPGGKVVMVKSTKLLNAEEFSTFLERVLSMLASYGVHIERCA